MLAPENPPRVASNEAAVTRVCTRAARGTDPPGIAMPLSVDRFDSDPAPSIEIPFGPRVTPGIVPAIAARSPAMAGFTWPSTPSCQRSADPTSPLKRETSFRARDGFSAVTFTAASVERSRANTKSAISSSGSPIRCTRRRAVLNPTAEMATR